MPSRIRQNSGQLPTDGWPEGPLLQVRTIYTAFVQGLFAAAPPGSYHWSPDNSETEIFISDESPIHVDTIGKRPAISFTRGPIRSHSLGQDDLLDYNFSTGTKKKGILIPGMMSVNCCSRVDVESEQIAWVVGEQLWMHREMLMRAGFFEIGSSFVVSAPSPAGSLIAGDSGDEWFATTVSTPFQFSRTSSFSPLGEEILREIDMQLRNRFAQVRGLGPLGTSHESGSLPYNIRSSAPGVEEHRVPHPLNPAQSVVIRPAHPHRSGIRAPSMGGRLLPIQQATVEQSDAPATVVTNTFKVS